LEEYRFELLTEALEMLIFCKRVNRKIKNFKVFVMNILR